MSEADAVLVFRTPSSKDGACSSHGEATLIEKARVRLQELVATYNESLVQLTVGENVTSFFVSTLMTLCYAHFSYLIYSKNAWSGVFAMLVLGLMFLYTGVTLWAKWCLEHDSRFDGAFLTASLEDRAVAIWNTPKRQRVTQLRHGMITGNLLVALDRLAIDDTLITRECEDMTKDDARKTMFERLNEDERVRAICLRVLIVTLQEKEEK